jgi:uncharacterized damage-inducible protein DinB
MTPITNPISNSTKDVMDPQRVAPHESDDVPNDRDERSQHRHPLRHDQRHEDGDHGERQEGQHELSFIREVLAAAFVEHESTSHASHGREHPTAMDPRVQPLAAILRLNTRLLLNCLDGLTDETARKRHGDGVNSAAFIAAHVTDSRFFILRTLGGSFENPLSPFLDKAKTIDDITEWPSLGVIRAAWTAVSTAIEETIDAASAEELEIAVDARFPGVDRTRLGALTFLVQHDSYHLGQLALLRKPAGLPAMSYR